MSEADIPDDISNSLAQLKWALTARDSLRRISAKGNTFFEIKNASGNIGPYLTRPILNALDTKVHDLILGITERGHQKLIGELFRKVRDESL